MASPFNSLYTSKIFKIFGIPQSGSATIPFRLMSLFGPSREPYDYSAIVTDLNNALTACSADQGTQVTAVVDVWDTNNLDYAEQEITADNGTMGTLYSVSKQKENIRQTIGKIISFYCPSGGFVAEIERASPYTGPRVVV